jgi:hypothetical protein
MPGARCTRSLVCKMKNTRVSHHRFTGVPGIPCAMVLTVSFVLFLVTGLSCHHHPCDAARIITSLTPASGRQNHTTSPSASVRFVSRTTASTASHRNVRDDRDPPLIRGETRELKR